MADGEGDVAPISLCFDRAHQLYVLHREKVAHEDGLINQRTTWFITIEAALIAALGLVVSSLVQPIVLRDLFWLFFSFALAGVAVCVTAAMGISAAQTAIDETNDRWMELKISDEDRRLFPALCGGGKKSKQHANTHGVGKERDLFRQGAAASRYLPHIFAVLWLCLTLSPFIFGGFLT